MVAPGASNIRTPASTVYHRVSRDLHPITIVSPPYHTQDNPPLRRISKLAVLTTGTTTTCKRRERRVYGNTSTKYSRSRHFRRVRPLILGENRL